MLEGMSSDQKGKYGLQNAEKYFYLNQVCCFTGFGFWQKDWKFSSVQIPNSILILSLHGQFPASLVNKYLFDPDLMFKIENILDIFILKS